MTQFLNFLFCLKCFHSKIQCDGRFKTSDIYFTQIIYGGKFQRSFDFLLNPNE